MDKLKKFIRTSDEETAAQLRQGGLIELPKDGNFYVFINEVGKVNFSESKGKLTFSDILTF